MRTVLVTNIVSPYRLPTWRVLAEQCGELHVIACAESEPNRVWDIGLPRENPYLHIRVLPGFHGFVPGRDWGIHLNPGLWRTLNEIKPTHVLVTGYDTPSYWVSMLYTKRHRIPLTLWWGSNNLSSRSRRGPIMSIRRRAARMADTHVTYGHRATEQLLSLGIDQTRIVTGTNSVDAEHLARLVRVCRNQSSNESCPSTVRFLYVGQFIERKGVRELLDAFNSVPQESASLTLVGYGPLDEELRTNVAKYDIPNVYFVGRTKTLAETAKFYAQSDVLIMPSLWEVWGLVINEALAAGLYVLSSCRAGVTPDLVEAAPIDVGMVFDPADVGMFQDVLYAAIERAAVGIDRDAISRWGRSHTPERYAAKIAEALALASGGRV